VWSTSIFAGVYTTYAADVNGDGRTDLVAIDGTSTWVMLSTGSRFAAPVPWSRRSFLGRLRLRGTDLLVSGRVRRHQGHGRP
jgi:hypothetical protein